MNGALGCAPNSGAAAVAIEGACKTAEVGETVNLDMEPTDFATVCKREGHAN